MRGSRGYASLILGCGISALSGFWVWVMDGVVFRWRGVPPGRLCFGYSIPGISPVGHDAGLFSLSVIPPEWITRVIFLHFWHRCSFAFDFLDRIEGPLQGRLMGGDEAGPLALGAGFWGAVSWAFDPGWYEVAPLALD